MSFWNPPNLYIVRRALQESILEGAVEFGEVVARNLCHIRSQEGGSEGRFGQRNMMGSHDDLHGSKTGLFKFGNRPSRG